MNLFFIKKKEKKKWWAGKYLIISSLGRSLDA
jgi:hypothetical protein